MFRYFLTGLVAVVLVACSIVSAEDAAVERSRVWQTYLSPAEQAALAEMAKPQERAAPGPDADMKALIAEARAGFDDLVVQLAPPLRDLPGEAFMEGGVEGLWFNPKGSNKNEVLLYLHGGGFLVGSARTGAGICGFLAKTIDCQAFSLEYPLAPESPYPAQLDSAVAAYRMLLGKGFKPEKIVVAGDSAGGNLTLTLLCKLRDLGIPLPAGAYLISPWANLTHSSPAHSLKAESDYVLTTDDLEMMLGAYIGEEDRKNPYISPAFADLRGLPPLIIQVGSMEILLDDSLTVARNAALADVPVWLSVWPGYTHDFQMFYNSLEGGKRALEDAGEFLDRALDGEVLRDD